MRVREACLAIAGLVGSGCVAAPQEGSGLAARAGTRVEVMLVPFDEGATLAEGPEAFDARVDTTDSLAALADGRGAFVIGVADGQGIALVPIALTDDVATAEDPGTDVPSDGGDLPVELASCAADCPTWCATTLDACEGAALERCDCSAGVPVDEEPACTRDCDEWCTTSLDHCDGDGFALCDCAGDDPGPDEAPVTCTWDCAEWCVSALDYCGDDGWGACADSCVWDESRPVPASGFAAEWTAPTVVDGVALVIGLTDPRAREALARSQAIGPQVGGTYGRQADAVLLRLLDAVAGAGLATDDPSLSCGQRLLNRGYRPTLSTSASETIRVGICQKGGLEVWPQSIAIRTGGSTGARFVFEHLTPGAGTPASEVAIRLGQAASTAVAPGRSVTVSAPLDPAVGLPLDVVVQGTGTTTRVRVTLQP